MRTEETAKYRYILAKEKSKGIAAVRKQQLRRDRHISRRKQQRYDALEAQGHGDYKWSGMYHQDLTMCLGYDGVRKQTPTDILADREIGKWNGYVFAMKWAFAKFVFIWYVLVIGLY